MDGAIFQMISHGIVSGALFLCVGILYKRTETKIISAHGGLVAVMPRFAFYFMIFTLASVGLPGTSGFIGEAMVIFGMFQVSILYGTLMALGVILGAAYMLLLYKKVMLGELNPNLHKIKDINMPEEIALAILAALVIILGVYPSIVLDLLHMPS